MKEIKYIILYLASVLETAINYGYDFSTSYDSGSGSTTPMLMLTRKKEHCFQSFCP
jgi:hypothetical protein